jgi:beta-galactosidase
LKTSRPLIFIIALFCILLPQTINAQKRPEGGSLHVDAAALQPGRELDLTGTWLYRPGYELASGERPESAADQKGYLAVGVPQMLNRIQWWLDDSEDFKRAEDARLKKLGFDTDRAEDGWYRLWLDLPELPKNRHLFIEFDGVAMISKAYCNGELLGDHAGMFSRFGFDLTPHLKPGKNLISIFVSMEKIPPSSMSLGQAVTVNLSASKIMSMSKGMFGPLSPAQDNRDYELHGIWQPVKLVVRDDAQIDDVWFNPTLDGARVQVEGHSLSGARVAVLKAQWTDPKTGKTFAEAQPLNFRLAADKTTQTLTISNVKPKLWTPADPNLYHLDVSLETEDGKTLDRWTHNVGFRTFEIRGNKFFLNGHPYWLRGADQLPYGKNPFDPSLARKLIQLMHDGNQRVTRTHATPWNEAWLDAADEIGLGVSIEGIRPWGLAGKIGTPPPAMFQHWLMENEDVVKRGRNHPSVLIWTIGNEMLLRDGKNLEKWKLLSEVVKETRTLDPYRPIVADSTYQREDDFYNSTLKPNGVDDGDIDDIHRYRGWYAESPFVTDSFFKSELAQRTTTKDRPFIGQEISSGYPDMDTGLPVLRYTRDLLTPQAWIGQDAYPGHDPAIFLEHHRAVTKRWAEQLRFQRGDRTAGFMMFSAEDWYHHTFEAKSVSPYPVYESMREAWAPIGIALESSRRRFTGGEELNTSIFVTNDDEQFRDLSDLDLKVEFLDPATRKAVTTAAATAKVDRIAYYETKQIPVRIVMPKVAGQRRLFDLRVTLLDKGKEVSRSTDKIEVFPPVSAAAPAKGSSIDMLSVGPELNGFVKKYGQFSSTIDSKNLVGSASVILVGPDGPAGELASGGSLRAAVERGATAILFSPRKKAQELFPQDVLDTKSVTGEYADFAPSAGTLLTANLQPMDLKWWGRKGDWRVFVADSAHRLKPGGNARELVRYIPAHSYIPAEKVPEQYMTVLFEIPAGKGRIWICDLDLENAISIDPAAQLFTTNLFRAAADPDSTRKLPVVPSHQEQLAKAKQQ